MKSWLYIIHILVVVGGCTASISENPAAPPSMGSGSYIAERPLEDLYDFILIDPRGPNSINIEQASTVLNTYDVIFLGEIHQHPGNHLAQMRLFRELHEKNNNLTLSLEQFERDVQMVVDDYLAGKIGEATMLKEARAWDNYPNSYRPLLEYAKDNNLPVIASEAPTALVRCVGQEGLGILDRLPLDYRTWIASKLHLHDGPYKEKFFRFAAMDHGHGGKNEETKGPSQAALRSFAAQVARDDTMAESIFLHLENNPGRTVTHLSGAFHSAGFLGTVERLGLRNPSLRLAVVHPLMVDDPWKPSVTTSSLKKGTFLLLLRSLPMSYSNEKEIRAASHAQMEFRNENRCEF